MTDKRSKDRVRFTLDSRYFRRHGTKNGMDADTCADILRDAFGEPKPAHCWVGVFNVYPNGFDIICRPSQFARFVVYRHQRGDCINGIRDLAPKLIDPPEPQRRYDTVVAQFPDLRRGTVEDILRLGGVPNDVIGPDAGTFDVSSNPHCPARYCN